MHPGAGEILSGASNLLAARSQMAFTLGFHILLVPFGVCLPLFALIANAYGLRHHDRGGAPAGAPLVARHGRDLRRRRRDRHGAVVRDGAPLAGAARALRRRVRAPLRDRGARLLPRGDLRRDLHLRLGPSAARALHLWLGAPLPLFALLGAFSIISANSWMNTPRGFQLDAAGQTVRRRSLGGDLQSGAAARAGALPPRRAALRRLRGRVDLRGRDVEGAARSPASPGLPDPFHHRRRRHAAADDGG